jgi:hypothetical protein
MRTVRFLFAAAIAAALAGEPMLATAGSGHATVVKSKTCGSSKSKVTGGRTGEC